MWSLDLFIWCCHLPSFLQSITCFFPYSLTHSLNVQCLTFHLYTVPNFTWDTSCPACEWCFPSWVHWSNYVTRIKISSFTIGLTECLSSLANSAPPTQLVTLVSSFILAVSSQHPPDIKSHPYPCQASFSLGSFCLNLRSVRVSSEEKKAGCV